MMHGHEKSDSVIVAAKPANKAERSAAELVEPRAETKGNAGWQSTLRTQSRACGSQALARMRQAFAVRTRGRSRMRESRTYGSVRGALSNERPYRVPCFFAVVHEFARVAASTSLSGGGIGGSRIGSYDRVAAPTPQGRYLSHIKGSRLADWLPSLWTPLPLDWAPMAYPPSDFPGGGGVERIPPLGLCYKRRARRALLGSNRS
jgi:hypothetical protein